MKSPVFEFNETKYIQTTFEEVQLDERRQHLTEEEIDIITKKAVKEAVDEALTRLYTEIGKSLVKRIVWGIVIGVVSFALGHQLIK